jgi:DNA-binding protein H-NS
MKQIERMTLKELRQLEERVRAAIVVREQQDRTELRNKVVALAEKAGVTVAELFGRGLKRRSAGVKYRHPKDPSLTWSGRGRRPKWLVEARGSIERFRVG